MKIVGTPKEISELMAKCNCIDCCDCILCDYCTHELFERQKEPVPIRPILIQKGVKHEDYRNA